MSPAPEQMTDAEFLATAPLSTPSCWQHAVIETVAVYGLAGPLLDAGCNCGLTLALLDRRGVGPLTGIDVDPAAIAKASALLTAEGADARLEVADLTHRLPLPDSMFQTVVCSEVLEHIPQPARAVAELHRVLRPGGTLLVTTPIADRSNGRSRPAPDVRPQSMTAEQLRHYHWSEMSPDELRRLLSRFDFELLTTRRFNLRGEGTLSNRGLRGLYRLLHGVPWLTERAGRNQLIVARRRPAPSV